MPQSWPSQWTILFLLFILSYFLVLLLTFFSPNQFNIQKSEVSLTKAPQFTWLW